jgi:hypothetical protein
MKKRYFLTVTAELIQGADDASFSGASFDTLKNAHVVSVRTRYGGKTVNKKTLISAAVGAVCILVLHDENGTKRHEIPLNLVEHLSANGFSAGLPVGYVVTLSTSKISIMDPSLAVSGSVVELVFEIEK